MRTIESVEKDILRKLKKWLPILHLDHLEITYSFISPKELKKIYGVPCYAGNQFELTYGKVILNFDEELSWFDDELETEAVLLHELLHVKLSAIAEFTYRHIASNAADKKQEQYIMSEFSKIEEETVDNLARCFLRFERKK